MRSCPNTLPGIECVDPTCSYCNPFRYRQLSPKLVQRWGYCFPIGHGTYAHWCLGCEAMHDFAVDMPFRNNAQWTYNGNAVAPTMQPSMNITVGPFPDGRLEVCHYFLTNGKIQYLGDCTHIFKGSTIDLPDIPLKALMNAQEIP